MCSFSFLFLFLSLLLMPLTAYSAAITPFYTQNQSPTALIFGLPAADDAAILAKGKMRCILAFDVANDFAADEKKGESILLDGENYRANLALRYGMGKGVEGGLDIPYIGIGGGIFAAWRTSDSRAVSGYTTIRSRTRASWHCEQASSSLPEIAATSGAAAAPISPSG